MVFCIFYIVKIAVVCLPLLFWEILSLKLLAVRVPTHAIRNRMTTLECNFDLDGEDLYAVKWYKDGNEIFRYVPKNDPPGKTFQRSDVYVEDKRSTMDRLVLSPVTLRSSGEYRCEVSVEAPSFETVQDSANMTVVALPDVEPTITGALARYKVGDWLTVNCTSGKSKPGANLTWLINGKEALKNYKRGPWKVITGSDGLEVTTLGLEFKVKPKHFKGGFMKLECLATIDSLYSKRQAETIGNVPVEHPHHSRKFSPHETKIPDRINSNIPTVEMTNNWWEIPKPTIENLTESITQNSTAVTNQIMFQQNSILFICCTFLTTILISYAHSIPDLYFR